MEASSLRIAPNTLDGPNPHICAFFNGMDVGPDQLLAELTEQHSYVGAGITD
jgi:hypothetical protein